MVGGDHVDRSVQQSLQQCFAVGGGAQGGIHLEAPVLAECILVQHQVVRCRLAGDVDAICLGTPDQPDALAGGDVADMVGTARFAAQLNIARNGAVLAFGAYPAMSVGAGVPAVMNIPAVQEAVVLAVRGDHLAQPRRLAHDRPHHVRALHAPAVVRKRDRLRCHAGKVSRLRAALADRQRTVGVHGDAGIAADDVGLNPQVRRAVRHGIQIRHGADGGVTAACRRLRPRADGLLVRITRLPEVHMHITEAGQQGIRNRTGQLAGSVRCFRLGHAPHREQGNIRHAGRRQERGSCRVGTGIHPQSGTIHVTVHMHTVPPEKLRRDARSPPGGVQAVRAGAHTRGSVRPRGAPVSLPLSVPTIICISETRSISDRIIAYIRTFVKGLEREATGQPYIRRHRAL